jgi:hypothetical protein
MHAKETKRGTGDEGETISITNKIAIVQWWHQRTRAWTLFLNVHLYSVYILRPTNRRESIAAIGPESFLAVVLKRGMALFLSSTSA